NSRSVRRMRVERRFLMIEKDYSHHFELVSNYEPAGDQPKAIQELTEGVKKNKKAQILLGATGTGKTYTVSNVIQNVNKPTLIIAHNKTLACQLYGELKEFFFNNSVENFVIYYNYYKLIAYVLLIDTFNII